MKASEVRFWQSYPEKFPVSKSFFLSLFYTNACAKQEGMGKFAEKGKGSTTTVEWKENNTGSTRLRKKPSCDRVLGTEDRARADQILEEMEESFQRLDRLLKVFDRMG